MPTYRHTGHVKRFSNAGESSFTTVFEAVSDEEALGAARAFGDDLRARGIGEVSKQWLVRIDVKEQVTFIVLD